MTQIIWLSFDLGVRGDYEGMYAWLDERKAQECGDNVAFLKFEFMDDLIENLKADIERNVQTSKKTRIYVIYRDGATGKLRGRFILGGRKSPPWSGYAEAGEQIEPDEI